MTNEQDGRNEPGFTRFETVRRQQGTSEQSITQYARYIGAARKLAGKPLLELTTDEVEALDLKLIKKARVLRTAIKMYLRANKRLDLVEALPRQNRPKSRRVGLDDVLMPEDVMALIAAADNKRDRALVAVLAATGARINEVLSARLGDVKVSNGAYQLWIANPKVKGAERYSPKIEGAFKTLLDEFIRARGAASKNDRLFHDLRSNRAGKMLASLRRKAGITKAANPHAFRHARVTWGVINKEDATTLSIGIWGQPVSAQLNRYTHYSGLEMSVGAPHEIDLPDVPAFPVVPIKATSQHVGVLQTEIEKMQERLDFQRKQTDAILEAVSKLPGMAGFSDVITEAAIKMSKVPKQPWEE